MKLQGLIVSLDFSPRVSRLEGFTSPIPASSFGGVRTGSFIFIFFLFSILSRRGSI